MSATDHFTSIDAFIANIKDEFASEKAALVKDYETKLKGAEIEAEKVSAAFQARLLEERVKTQVYIDQALEARAMAADAISRAARLIAQFDTVAKVFEEAKKLAEGLQTPAAKTALAAVDSAAKREPPAGAISRLQHEIEATLGQMGAGAGTPLPPNNLG